MRTDRRHRPLKKEKEKTYEDFVKRRRNLRWTLGLMPVYLVLTFLLIFYGHKMDGAQVFLFLVCLGIPILLGILWTETNSNSKWKQMFSFFKGVLLALPFGFFPMNGPAMYQEYQIKKNRTLTYGVVTNTFSEYNNRGGTWSYYADINYFYNGQLVCGRCNMRPDEYKREDSVIIVYSSEIPEFYELGGKKKPGPIN